MTFVAAVDKLRPLRDTLVLEPEDVVYSRWLIVEHKTKPLKGRVLAVGPGDYPSYYLDDQGRRLPPHAEKNKRKKRAFGKLFVPTQVKIGDRVELGGSEIEGYAFEGFFWGDRYCIWCTERDVAGVLEHSEALDQGAAP